MQIRGGYRRYDEIAFLRGFAITTVVLMHLFDVYWNEGELSLWLRFAAALGGTGGHVFIFCSGFGLYLSWLRQPLGAVDFLRRRFLKVYLPFLIFAVMHFFLPHWGVEGADHFRRLLSNVFLYKMFYERYICSYGLQLWFVSTILELYLVFLPLCRLRKRLSMRAFVLIGLGVSAAWWTVMYVSGLERLRIWNSFFPQYLWEFMLGMVVAEILFQRESIQIPAKTLILTGVCGLGLQAGMKLLGGLSAAFNDIPSLLGYSAVVLLIYLWGGKHVRRFFQWIDTISYEWFLIHVDAIMWGYYYARMVTPIEPLRAIAATVFSLMAAWVFAWMIRWLMRLLRVDGRASATNR